MRVLIVDDEPLARDTLVDILSTRTDIDTLDTATDAVDALHQLSRRDYDVMLLDINMPEISGVELLEQMHAKVRHIPSVVFVTAHEEYAITAFEKHAIDYVLKPFRAERISAALDHAKQHSETERVAKLVEALPLLQGVPRRESTRIAIKIKGSILFINPADIISIQAQGNYVLLQRERGTHLLRESISVMAEKMEPFGFVRLHRSMLINRRYVEEIRPYSTGEYGLRLKGGKEYTITRTFKKNLRSLAEFWVGGDSSLR